VYGFETPEEEYDRLKRDAGWFDETPLERLADKIIPQLQRELNTATVERDEYESEVSYLQERVDDLEQTIHDGIEESRGQDSEQRVEELEVEIEFLKTLVADMEEELAALDSAA
jgi:predicted  nucleic acid-binding Zn-ribbon protein